MALFYTDLGFQNLVGLRAATSLAPLASSPTYLGGKAGLADAKSALDAFRGGLPKMSPKMAESLDPAAVIVWFWATYPFTLGSYASAKAWTIHHDVGGGGGARS